MRPGPATHWLPVWGVWAWETRHQPRSARSCELALRAAGASRGPLPTGCGCGGRGRGDPSPAPQRALLRAGFARCGGGTRAPGGSSLARVWGVRYWALTRARPPFARACGQGLLHNGCGCGVGAWRPVTNPTARSLACWLCTLRGRHEDAPRGGVSLAWMWGIRGWALFYAGPPVLRVCGRARCPLAVGAVCWGGAPSLTPERGFLRAGFAPCGGGTRAPLGERGRLLPGCWASMVWPSPTPECSAFGREAGLATQWVWLWCAGVGTRHRPHSARSCEQAFRAAGAPRGGGASLAWVWGVHGWALPHAQTPVFRACGRGPLGTGSRCGVWA